MAESVNVDSRKTTVPKGCNLQEGYRISDRYVIRNFIDGGGLGCVYLAEDLRVYNTLVVVKTLNLESIEDDTARKKFKQEAEGPARVRHEGVVRVLDQGQLPDRNLFLVMEYVEGESLRRLIPKKGMDFDLLADLVRQISSALGAAHEEGVYHRDLKPENILIRKRQTGSYQVKLIDFGIAKVLNSLVTKDTLTAKHWGTLPYMAPEQLRGEEVSASSDVYALGVITYEMITGDHAPKFKSSHELIERLNKMRADTPVAARNVLSKALEEDPTQRYQNADEFGEALVSTLIKRKAEDRLLKSRTRYVVIAVLAVLLAGIAVWWAEFKSRKPDGDNNIPPNSTPIISPRIAAGEMSISYYLTVQKTRDGKPYQEPFKSSGQEIFESGYKFKFNLISPEPGYLYLFNEGAADDGKVYFNILYPTPKRNNGSAQVTANQQVVTGENAFGGKPDTEKFWIVWTKEQLPLLETAKTAAFTNAGKIRDTSEEQRLRAFLQEYSVNKPEVIKDVESKQTIIKGRGTVIVDLLLLEHR
jgi:serine/threonine protein kinase